MLNIVATKRQVISTDIICSLVLWEPMMAWQIRRSCTICTHRNSNWWMRYEFDSVWSKKKRSHLGRVCRPWQHHVDGASWEELQSRRTQAEYSPLFEGGELPQGVLLGGGDRRQDCAARQISHLGLLRSIDPPVQPLSSQALIGHLEVVMARPRAWNK